ncbi:hypothetical protein HPB50_027957 [Hyalomma asiaticum]|nr:hypothetical protein HPB50_027957 [Hyalomma asiaticum]
MRSTLQCRDAEVVQLKGRLHNVQQSQADEAQQPGSKIEPLKELQPSALRKVAELKRCASKENEEPAVENGAVDEVVPLPLKPQPRQPLRDRNLRGLWPENNALMLPADPRPSPQSQAERRPSSVVTQVPVSQVQGLPGCTADPCTDVESQRKRPWKEKDK